MVAPSYCDHVTLEYLRDRKGGLTLLSASRYASTPLSEEIKVLLDDQRLVNDQQRLTAHAIEIIEAFRRRCMAYSFVEDQRVAVVSRHDPSIRFTNSTISVLKRHLSDGLPERRFLVQPALRLRNLAHFKQTGSASPFGCAFLAFGLLAPADDLVLIAKVARDFLCSLGVLSGATIEYQVHRDDRDLVDAGKQAGLNVRVVDPLGPHRHVFGLEGVTGRNANLHVGRSGGLVAVANVIVIERGGVSIGVELAFGVNMILVGALDLPHPVLAAAGASANAVGVTDFMAIDCLHSGVVLAMEGLRPVARGRGGNYRDFLRILADRVCPELVVPAARAVAHAEAELRRHASDLTAGVVELDPARAAEALLDDLRRVGGH